jgi:hypothetical protein
MLLGVMSSEIGLFIAAFVAVGVETILISTLYLYTPEVFPTGIRVTAFGVCAFGHRFAPTIAPFVIAALISVSFELACVVMGACLVAVCLLAFTLKVNTFNTDLVEEQVASPAPASALGSSEAEGLRRRRRRIGV